MKKDDNIVYIGNKPTMTYVTAIMTQFASGRPDVRIKARGKVISKAVDVAEIVRNKFIQDAKIKNISIGTQEIQDGDEKINVSVIEILMGR
jgi:DNA-binding protein